MKKNGTKKPKRIVKLFVANSSRSKISETSTSLEGPDKESAVMGKPEKAMRLPNVVASVYLWQIRSPWLYHLLSELQRENSTDKMLLANLAEI